MRKVSVIVPCYNGAAVIGQCIESVYTQEYGDVELIVVDDGSTDGSKQVILAWQDRFAKKGWALNYVYQENRGLGGAIDTGLKHVTGEYLTLLDADDYFLPGSIGKKAAFLDKNPDFAGVRSNGWMARGEEKRLFVTSEKEKTQTDYFHGLLCDGFTNWAGSYMVRTDILFDFYPDRNIYPSRFGQNMQILLPVAYKRKFGFIDEPLMVYVLHENSLSQAQSPEVQYQKDEKNAQGYREIYEHMLDLILKDLGEHQKYLNIFNASHYRCAMGRDIKFGKLDAMQTHYQQLRETGLATLGDRIAYYGTKKSPLVIPLKVIRRCRMLLKNDGRRRH